MTLRRSKSYKDGPASRGFPSRSVDKKCFETVVKFFLIDEVAYNLVVVVDGRCVGITGARKIDVRIYPLAEQEAIRLALGTVIVEGGIDPDHVSFFIDRAHRSAGKSRGRNVNHLERSRLISYVSVNPAIEQATEASYQGNGVIGRHPHIRGTRTQGAGKPHIRKHTVLQNEAIFYAGGVNAASRNVAAVVDSESGGCGRSGIINLGEDALMQKESMLSRSIFHAAHNITVGVNGACHGECGIGKVKGGVHVVAQQKSMGSAARVVEASNNIAVRIYAVRDGQNGIWNVKPHVAVASCIKPGTEPCGTQ
jgi:hypothetical protein